MLIDSKPTLFGFDPKIIPSQYETIKFVKKFDYSKGAPEILLSGSIGSSKSLLLAHLVVTHCLNNKGARALLGRQVRKDLRLTLVKEVFNHIKTDLREGIDFKYNKSSNAFEFANGSEIISASWANKDFEQFRSLKLSCAAVEEATENNSEFEEFYSAIYSRLGRTDAQVSENFMISATNPDSPSHWLYKRFNLGNEQTRDPMRKVFYSKTTDNPFLPAWYIENQKQNYDTKMYRRMVLGLWEEIKGEVIYYNYESERNYRSDIAQVNEKYPLDIMFDFNIAEGKPMSSAIGQYIDGIFSVYKSFIVDGARTLTIMEEMSDWFEHECKFRVFGDASGKARDTRSIKSDYDIIRDFLSNYKRKNGTHLTFESLVPLANPPVKERHNKANASFLDANNKVSFLNHDKEVDEGFRLTKLKKSGQYIEDDSYRLQHVTTAVTYWIHYLLVRHKADMPAPYRR